VRIKFDELPANCLPRSTTARFTEHWQRSVGDEGFLEHVVEKWRTSDIGAGGDLGQMTLIAEGLAPDSMVPPLPELPRHGDGRRSEPHHPLRREPDPQRQAAYAARTGAPASARPTTLRNPPEPAIDEAAAEDKDVPGSALKSLRDRLIQRQQR
jgi:hypothetical protein